MASLANIEISDAPGIPGAKIVSISGQLDETNLPDLSANIDPLVTTEGVNTIVLNFGKLEFLNSKIIGYLADLHSRMDQAGRRMMIAEASDSVIDILELVGLTTLISCYPSNQAALQDNE